jgi:hypothetical protein
VIAPIIIVICAIGAAFGVMTAKSGSQPQKGQ